MQIRSPPRWLRMVSRIIAVLPTCRSPMMSSRWPRPIGIIESMALIPVWSGSFTPCRSTTPLGRLDWRAAVERVAERVDNASEQLLADGDARHGSAPPHGLAFLDLLPLAEQRCADVVLLQIERDPGDAVLELEQLERQAVLEPVDPGDAIADLQDGADLREVGLDVELLDPLAKDRGDLFRA